MSGSLGLPSRERVLFDERVQLAFGFGLVARLYEAAKQRIEHVSLNRLRA